MTIFILTNFYNDDFSIDDFYIDDFSIDYFYIDEFSIGKMGWPQMSPKHPKIALFSTLFFKI